MKLGFGINIIKKSFLGEIPFLPPFPDFGANLIYKDFLGYGRVFQDADGVTPVYVSGDPVGQVVDYSNFNNDAVQIIASSRPAMLVDAHGHFYLKHDRIDDYLTLSSLNSGLYTFGISTWSGVQVYELTHFITGEFKFDPVDTVSRVLVLGSISVQNKIDLMTWLESRRLSSGANDVLRLYCWLNSVNVSIVESSNSDSSWVLGDGQTATGVSLVKTITAPQTLIYQAGIPNNVTELNFTNKGLYGLLDFSKLTKLTHIYMSTNGFSGQLNLSANPLLDTVYLSNNLLGGNLNLSTNTVLKIFQVGNNLLRGVLNISNNTVLQVCGVSMNKFTGFSGTVSNTVDEFYAQNNNLTQGAIDDILLAFVNANRTTGARILNLGGIGNSAPSSTGLTYKTTLVGRGWTVTHN